jgi:hypothetical protein
MKAPWKTTLVVLPAAGWLFAAPVAFATGLDAKHQDLKAEQRAEQQDLKAEHRGQKAERREQQAAAEGNLPEEMKAEQKEQKAELQGQKAQIQQEAAEQLGQNAAR